MFRAFPSSFRPSRRRDKEDLLFGIEQKVDYVAASFIRKAEDVLEIKAFLREHGGEHIDVISKIENARAWKTSTPSSRPPTGSWWPGETWGWRSPLTRCPIFRRPLSRNDNHLYLPVITATQMLDSMIRNPRPTRAEVTDVANAIYDGTDAVMLSGETAMGKYPVEAVRMMAEIALETEQYLKFESYRDVEVAEATPAFPARWASRAVDMVEHIGASWHRHSHHVRKDRPSDLQSAPQRPHLRGDAL